MIKLPLEARNIVARPLAVGTMARNSVGSHIKLKWVTSLKENKKKRNSLELTQQD